MASKKVTVKKYFETDNSYITILNNSLLVMDKNFADKAFTAIKVCKGFYIELGRPLSDFDTVLANTRIPIMFEFVIESGGFEHYKIVRMQTGNIDDTTLGSLVCKDGIITRLTCDKSYKEDEDYLRYERIGSLWKVTFKHSTNPEENKERVKNTVLNLLNTIDNKNGLDIKTSYVVNKAEVSVTGRGMDYTYTFILNEKTGLYELVMITLNH